MAERQQKMNGWTKLYELIQFGVDVCKVTLAQKTTSDQSVVGKEDDHVSNGKLETASEEVEKEIYLVRHKGKLSILGIVLDSELLECLSELFNESHLGVPAVESEDGILKISEKWQRSLQSNGCDERPPAKAIRGNLAGYGEVKMVEVLQDLFGCGDCDSFSSHAKRIATIAGESKTEVKNSAKKEPGTKLTGDVHNGGPAETKSQGTKELKAKASNKSNVDKEPRAKTKSKATDSKAGKETGVEKELKATEESDSGKSAKATVESNAKQESKATEDTESRKRLKATEKFDAKHNLIATEESDSIEKAKASEESDSRKRAKSSGKSDAKQESKATEEFDTRKKAKASKKSDSKKKTEATGESYSRKKVKVTKESDYRKKTKATEESSAKQKLKTTEESSCEKEARITVADSEVGNGTDNQEEKESSRPGSKNVRTCMTCGLQEPAPKMFKKCKRCKDENCLNPPYYCGRDCQVLDWTGRHRQEHEKN